MGVSTWGLSKKNLLTAEGCCSMYSRILEQVGKISDAISAKAIIPG